MTEPNVIKFQEDEASVPSREPGVWMPPDEPQETKSAQRMQQIVQVLEDPDEVDLAGAMRILAVEIADSLTPKGGGLAGVHDARSASARIKNLRELSKQIQEAADMSTRDFLNFDGPRFQFVFKELLLLFRQSVIKTGYASDAADHILRVFREEFLAKEQDLRRETAKVDMSLMASTLSIEGATTPSANPSNTGESHA